MSKKSLSIEIISDIVCPWCWVGKRKLEKALATYDVEDYGRVSLLQTNDATMSLRAKRDRELDEDDEGSVPVFSKQKQDDAPSRRRVRFAPDDDVHVFYIERPQDVPIICYDFCRKSNLPVGSEASEGRCPRWEKYTCCSSP